MFPLFLLLIGCPSSREIAYIKPDVMTSIDSSRIPAFLINQLSMIHFDSTLNVVSKPAGMMTREGSTLLFTYRGALRENQFWGELRKDSTYAAFEPITTKIQVRFTLTEMCCDCGHNPRHCAYTRRGIIDTSAKYHCTAWSALILSR